MSPTFHIMATKKTRPRSAPRRKKPASSSFSRVRFLFWTVLLGLTAGSLVLAFVLLKTMPFESIPFRATPSAPPSVTSREKTQITPPRTAQAPHRKIARPPASVPPDRNYEEKSSEPLESKIREVDMAILQAALQCGIPSEGLRHTGVEQRSRGGRNYHFQTITIDPSADWARLARSLSTTLTSLVDGAVMTSSQGTGKTLRIAVDGFPTHLLVPGVRQAGRRPPQNGALAIVIDDMGQHIREGEILAGLPVPVTFSVLPYNDHAREVAELAHRNGLEVLIHLPMEPQGYPEKANPGPGALFSSMSETNLRSLVRKAVQHVPHAVGANNHMGSRFTESGSGMDAVLEELAGRRLFFLDSMTTSRSQGKPASRRAHVPYIQRNIFLDNVQDQAAIVFQLRKAETLAKRKGMAVAIGHPYPETLHALAEWARTRDTSIRIVTVQQLLKMRG